MKHNATIKFVSDRVKPVSIGKQLELFMAKGDGDAIDDLKSEYELPDKRVIMTRIKVLMDAKKWEETIIFVERHQKDFKIPVELIADLLMEKG